MTDTLGDRMKDFYENRTRYMLPRRTYTVIRIDGKAFKNYTKGLIRPFDKGLIEDMNSTAEYLCKNIQGEKLAYVQSDEISIVLSDFTYHFLIKNDRLWESTGGVFECIPKDSEPHSLRKKYWKWDIVETKKLSNGAKRSYIICNLI